MSAIKLSTDKLEPFIKGDEIQNMAGEIKDAAKLLQERKGPGSDFLGWLDLPSSTPEKLIDEVKETADEIRSRADAFISIGIGGSYLGAKAAIEFSRHSFSNQLVPAKRIGPEIYFAGHNISSDYLSDLMDIMEDRRVCLNVISKSGTTTEPAIAFRILKSMMERRYGKAGAKGRIVVTTDKANGALKQVADEEGYKSFVIPDDVGGRYSVLTPVGLLPIAVAGTDIDEVILGARTFEGICKKNAVEENPACLHAATRKLLYKKGKQIEILSSFHPSLHYIAEWWKQLAGESEGKDGQGIFPAAVDLTSDLHSMGQWIQEGQRNIFETFLTVKQSNRQMTVPEFEDDGDGLNYIAGRSLDYVNEKAYQGTAEAHRDGGVPNMTISLKDRSAQTLGQLFYFFEYSVALSGYLMGVNPFDQPGVEFYKKNMFRLLGKNI